MCMHDGLKGCVSFAENVNVEISPLQMFRVLMGKRTYSGVV